jgi:sortase A
MYQLKSFQFSRGALISPVESSYSDYNDYNGYNSYNNYKNWFAEAPKLPTRETKITHYNISIPKLKIENAVVAIGGEDLSESLIQYPGTALPGEYGNTVIFGHSVLPQFYNPKNYKTIFSTLPTLKEGDEILVDFDGIRYRYVVVKMVEVSPNDVSVLEQRYDGEYLSLVTCVPPGTYLRRLIVKAKLVKPL